MARTFEQELSDHGVFIYPITGDSMRPLLKPGRDVAEISRKPVRRGDVALYRQNGRYILHRILQVKDGYFVAAGDNCTARETVSASQIVGVLTAILRPDGRRRSMASTKYRLYSLVWRALYPLRALWILSKRKLLERKKL